MRAGSLTERVTLLSPTLTSGTDYAEPLESWTEVATVYAAIEPLIGREYFMNREVQSDLSTKVRIRFRDDVQVNWRVALGTRIFDIQSVINPFMKNEELLLMCAELPQ